MYNMKIDADEKLYEFANNLLQKSFRANALSLSNS